MLANIAKGARIVLGKDMYPHSKMLHNLSIDNEIVTEPTISKSLLEQFVGEPLDYTKVIAENDQLTKEYNHIVKGYGFENFYDLYLFADSSSANLELIAKGGQKDLHKLKAVTRTVIRNGKPMKTTIYEDTGSDKGDNKNPLDKTADTDNKLQPVSINDLSSTVLDMTHPNPKELTQLAKQAGKLQGTFNTDCSSYAVFTGDNGELRAVIGFKLENNYLRLVFTQMDKLTSGTEKKALFMLTVTAWKQGTGAIHPDTENRTALALLKEYGYTKQKGSYKVTASSLKGLLGTP